MVSISTAKLLTLCGEITVSYRLDIYIYISKRFPHAHYHQFCPTHLFPPIISPILSLNMTNWKSPAVVATESCASLALRLPACCLILSHYSRAHQAAPHHGRSSHVSNVILGTHIVTKVFYFFFSCKLGHFREHRIRLFFLRWKAKVLLVIFGMFPFPRLGRECWMVNWYNLALPGCSMVPLVRHTWYLRGARLD
jgi:hypothetical protein